MICQIKNAVAVVEEKEGGLRRSYSRWAIKTLEATVGPGVFFSAPRWAGRSSKV